MASGTIDIGAPIGRRALLSGAVGLATLGATAAAQTFPKLPPMPRAWIDAAQIPLWGMQLCFPLHRPCGPWSR